MLRAATMLRTTPRCAPAARRALATATQPKPAAAAAAAVDAPAPPAPLPFSAIPRVPAVPLLGSVPAILLRHDPTGLDGRQFHEAIADVARKYGPLVRLALPQAETLVVSDPAIAGEAFRVLNGEFPHRPALPTWVYYRENIGFPAGFAFLNGPEWRRLRYAAQTLVFDPKHVYPKFTKLVSAATADAMPVFEQVVRAAGTEADGRTPARVNLDEVVMRWSIESVSDIVLGQRLGALQTPVNPLATRMIKVVTDSLGSTGVVLKLPEFVWKNQLTRSARQHFAALKAMHDMSGELMDNTLAECMKDPARLEGTFLGYLLSKEGDLTRQELLSIAIDFLGGGIDTTSRSALFSMYLLGNNPEAQAKLREEVLRVVGPEPNDVLPEHLNQLKYLRNVVKESMRLYPVAPFNSRIASEDVVFAGYQIPKGTNVMLNHFAMSRDPKYVKDPLAYRPERWEGRGEVHPNVSQPFGGGARMCVGRRIAEMEIYVLLSHLVRRFEILPSPEPLKVVNEMLNSNEGPVPLRLRPLKQ